MIRQADERTVVGDLLATMFQELPDWDEHQNYTYPNLLLAYENAEQNQYLELSKELNIADILDQVGLVNGVLRLVVLSQGSACKNFCQDFLGKKLSETRGW